MTAEVKKLIEQKQYKQALDKCSSVAEEDEVFDDYFITELKALPQDRLVEISDTFKEELKSLGFDESTNPFITFVKRYLVQNKLDKYKYNVLHNAYIDGTIKKTDLNGKSIDGWNHIIFNPSLYEQTDKDIIYILKVDEWIKENEYSVKNLVTNKRVIEEYKKFNPYKEMSLKFKNDLLYEGNTTIAGDTSSGDKVEFKFRTGGQPGGKVNKATDIQKALDWCQAAETSTDYVNPDKKDRDVIDVKADVKTSWVDRLKKAGVKETDIPAIISILKSDKGAFK